MVSLIPFLAKSEFYLSAANFEIQGDARENFRQELIKAGFEPPQVIELGKLQRIKAPEDKPHKKSGWMVYNEFADEKQENKVLGVGVYGSWRGNPDKVTWTSRSQDAMTQGEKAHYHAQIEIARVAREAEEKLKQTEAAKEALRIWEESESATDNHPYLVQKGIKAPANVVLSRESLAVPVIIDETISSLQFIRPDGSKKFLAGGKTKGGYFKIAGSIDIVFIVEGMATGASVNEATGSTVYCAFNAGNLYEIASFVKRTNPTSQIVIAGDDDIFTEGNTGRTKAIQAAQALEIDIAFPVFEKPSEKTTDFNDMAKLYGLSAVKAVLKPDRQVKVYQKKEVKKSDAKEPPQGILREIFNYYNATSGNKQHGFATQTALAIGSIILGRSFRTNKDNFTSLYFLNVGKSSTGKEHSKTVVEQILGSTNRDGLIAGDGYTSAGAVFSALLDKPRHISVIDEFGRYLEAGVLGKSGNLHQREANTKLMESIGRAHTVMRPPTYSTMTLKKEAADSVKSRKVYNPAITLLTMTTPDTLFKTLDIGSIKDGFINRFIISISDAERAPRIHKDAIEVPEIIKDWIIDIETRSGNIHNAAEPPKFITLDFSTEAMTLQDEFQLYCIDQANKLDDFGMAEITGRSNEMAMRVALICALTRDAQATTINVDDMAWAIGYIRTAMDETISRLKMTISASDFEGHKKEILQALRNAAPNWVKFSSMNKMQPYTKHQRKYLQEILDSLVDAELADKRQSSAEGRGRPTTEWIALK